MIVQEEGPQPAALQSFSKCFSWVKKENKLHMILKNIACLQWLVFRNENSEFNLIVLILAVDSSSQSKA